MEDDDASPTVTLSLSDALIAEDAGSTTVTASLSHASSVATTVAVSASPDSPAVAGDYLLSANTTLAIAAGQTASTGTVTVTGVDNDVDAADKTVTVKGSAGNTVGISGPSDATLTLEDDDTRGVTVSKADLDIDEGGSGTYTVVLDSEPTGQVVVTPSRSSGDEDVTVSGALTFTTADWATAQTVTVRSAQDLDAVDDAAEIGHAVSGGDYGTVVAAPVDVAVDDDDPVSSGVILSVSPDEVGEGASATTVTVTARLDGGTRSGATPVAVTVGSGTAVSGTDFAVVAGFTITIPADVQSQTGTFSLSPTQDTVDEPDETVAVGGTTTVTGFAVTGTTVEITDDDASPTVTLSLSDASIVEDAGSTTVTASLSHASSVATTVAVSASPDSPAVAGDYLLSANTTLAIAAGQTASTGTVTVTGVDNDVDAADKTVTVKGSAGNTVGISGPSDAILTLEDDDTRGVTVSKADLDIDEGGSGTYTVVLDSEPTGQVVVTPSRSSGDEDVTVSGALTFTTADWATARTVTVSAGQDSDAADDTAVIGHSVSGADYGGVTAAAVDVTVDDDETASSGVTLTVSPDAVGEGASATTVTVTARLNGGTRSGATPVTVTVGSGTAVSGTDFAAVAGFTITIPADVQSQTGTFSLSPTQDTLDEPDETVAVGGTTTVTGFAVTGTTVEITDDDASPTVSLSLSDALIAEDAGSTTVTASLSHASSVATTVAVSVSPDSPAVAADYSLSANAELTIAAGQTASTGTVTVTGVDNDVDAADKTVTVKGSAGNTVGISGPSDAILTLEDDDTRGVTVSKADLDIDEGGSGTYTVVLDSEPTGQVVVTPSRSSGDEDVTVSGALTFTTSNWDTARTVTVSAGQDSDAADDTAVIGHSVSGADYGGVTAAAVDVAVDDDETASSGVTLTVSPDEVSEGASATTVTVTARLDGGTRSGATPVVVTVGSGTAVSGTDFAVVAGFTITIPADVQSQTGTFSLSPTQDTVDEPDETVAVGGTTTVSGFSVTGTTVEITDDDASPTVTLSLSDASIVEDAGSTTVTASLSHASSVATTVAVSASPDSPAVAGDYLLSANTTLAITAGETASTGTVTVTGVDNDVDAADKTVTVKGSAGNTAGISGPSDAILTLLDDDTRGVTVSKADLDIDEGGSGTYTVVLTSEPTGEVVVTPSRSSGDEDVTVSGALTFTTADWATARTVTVSAGQDSDAVDDTAVIGHSVSGADYGGVTAAAVDVTVDDDETASSGVTLTVSPDAVGEGASATTVTVTARLNGGTRSGATPVAVTVGSGTATSGTDFAAVTGFDISIAAGTLANTGTFTLSPTQDTVDEPDETVRVDGATTVPGFMVTGTTLEIMDDDGLPAVTLSLSSTSIPEDGGVATVAASLSHASSAATTVAVSVSADPPTVAGDYTLSANTTLTITAGETASTGTVTVTGVDNDVDAADKTVTVKGAAGNTAGISGPSDAILTLLDDDTRGVTVSKADLDIDEGGSGTYTVVLTSEPTGEVVVTPSRSSGDEDVTVSGALTFTTADWATAQTLTVSSAQDSDAVDDTAVIGHSVSGADYGGVTAAPVDVTVDDDETASSVVTLTVSPDEVGEGAAATTVTVTARLDGAMRSGATPVAVTVGSGTATSGTDFAAVRGFDISIAAGTLANTGTFTLSPTQDTVDEPDETVRVDGATTVPGFMVTVASIGIADDDDAPTVTMLMSSTLIPENGGATKVTASLSHASSEPTTVTVSVEPVFPATDSDYILSSNATLLIAAGATASTGVVTITAVDNDAETPDRTVTVKCVAHNTLGVLVPADQVLTLKDDDEPPPNTPPTGRDKTAAMDEDGVYVFAASDFGFSDSDPGDSLAGVRIVTTPAVGALELRGAAVGAGDDIDVSDIDDGGLVFRPAPDASGSPYASFTFRVNDGAEDSAAANAMTMNVVAVNDPATGRPGISGSPGLGEVLSADTSGIVDVDGMEHAEFRYQWVRVVGDEATDIPAATGSTHTLEVADMGAELRVRVGFTDDAGFDEVVVSEAVETPRISAPREPLNFRAEGGDGRAVLTWEPPLDDGGAPVAGYEYRHAEGASVPADAAWNSAGTDLTATVDGLANGEPNAFEVRALNLVGAGPAARASAVPATVPEAPVGLTATAGDAQAALAWQAPASDGGAGIIDYEYRFAIGPNVPEDGVWRSAGPDLGETVTGLANGETYAFEVRAVNSLGAGAAAFGAAELPDPNRFSDAMLEGWLARFGRAASSDTAELIRRRLEDGPRRSQLIFGGQRIDGLFQGAEERAGDPTGPARASWQPGRMGPVGGSGPLPGDPSLSANGLDRWPGGGFVGGGRTAGLKELLLRSSFHFSHARNDETGEARGAGPRTVWGGVASNRFDARVDSMALEGEVGTGILGFDGQWGRLLVGLALSHSRGEGGFRNGVDASGAVRSELTGLYPYAHFQAGPAVSFWGTLGYGTGRLRLVPEGGASVRETDLDNAMLAVGGRGVLSRRMGESGRFEFALRSDALLTNTGADAIEGFDDDAEGSTSRVRLMLEGSGSIALRGGTLSPSLEAGFRHDGGDAESGMGVELGAGLAWSSGRLTLQLNGRGLLTHEDDDYGEWGYGAVVQYRGADDGSGARLGLSAAGGRERGGAEAMWSLRDAGTLASGRTASPGQRIQLELGYGLRSAWWDALWYPYLGMVTGVGNGRDLRMGLKLSADDSLDMVIEVGRREGAIQPPEHSIELRGAMRW